jgi:hypothetical protein
VLNDAGQAAFLARLTGTSGGADNDEGIYRREAHSGGLTLIVRENPAGIILNGITTLIGPTLNAAGDVGFRAVYLQSFSTGGGSLFRAYRVSGGTRTTIASEENAAPDGNGTFRTFGVDALNQAGQLAFTATLNGTSGGTSDDTGIYRGSGGAVTQIAREGAVAPPGNGTFSSFDLPALNDVGQAAFFATLTGTSGGTSDNWGIFLGSGAAVAQIAAKAPLLPTATAHYPVSGTLRSTTRDKLRFAPPSRAPAAGRATATASSSARAAP